MWETINKLIIPIKKLVFATKIEGQCFQVGKNLKTQAHSDTSSLVVKSHAIHIYRQRSLNLILFIKGGRGFYDRPVSRTSPKRRKELRPGVGCAIPRPSITNYYHFLFFFYSPMRKVLAVASVGTEHKELVFKELKKIFRRIKISLDILLQEEAARSQTTLIENGNVFSSYPNITLIIPNYEQHRQYLEKVYKSNVLFSKFILLISEGNDYDELVLNRNEDILKQQCRNWNRSVSCTFDSSPVFTSIEEQMTKIDRVLGQMDIRGKISEIDAQRKFHLIQDYRRQDFDSPKPPCDLKVPSKVVLLKLFFGLEIGCGRKTRGGRGASTLSAYNGYNYSNFEFMDYEQEEKMMDEEEETQDIPIQIQQTHIIANSSSSSRRSSHFSSGKVGWSKRQAKSRLEESLAPISKPNPYLKKTYHHEVELSDLS